ncbi:MAG: PaaX family transcriptional regulator [Burkholderiales bacterium]|nr:PaaX family transcriptional regulator [Burkholderiales bacterium]
MAPNPRHLILNLLLGAGSEPLPARTAVAACALFGLRENSVRVALVRLAASGLVEPAGRGSYRLGPQAAGLAADVGQWRGSAARLRAWQGSWIAVHTPPGAPAGVAVEGTAAGARKASPGSTGAATSGSARTITPGSARAITPDGARAITPGGARAARRTRERALRLLGLRELDRGLHLRPDNLAGSAAAVRERLARLGLDGDAAVFLARDLDPLRDKRARALWDGAALNRGYRATRQRLERWLEHAGRLPLADAARDSFTLGHDAIHQLVFDPLLPAPLVDADARQRFIDAVVRFDAAGQTIWKRFREETTA